MHFSKAVILTFFCLFNAFVALAQRPKVHNGGKSMYTRERFSHNATRVKGQKAKTICPVFQSSRYPYQGLGVKLGDPFAITYKFYPNEKFSFAVDVGRPSSSLYNRYFREKFYEYIKSDTFSTSEAAIIPITHKVKSDLVMELKFLYHIDVSKFSPGLQVYLGGGWEWKRTQLQYDYTYSNGNSSPDQFGRFERNRATAGPQAIIGIEYAYFKIPVSAFMELEYFKDIQADIGWSRIEGGVGLRFIF